MLIDNGRELLAARFGSPDVLQARTVGTGTVVKVGKLMGNVREFQVTLRSWDDEQAVYALH